MSQNVRETLLYVDVMIHICCGNLLGIFFNEPVAYATGTIQGKIISVGNTVLSSAITKTIHKVVEATYSISF